MTATSSSHPRRYRVALVGCGDIAQTGHLPSLLRHPRFELAVLCDTRPERVRLLADMAARAGRAVDTAADFRTLLTRGDIDAVMLALHPEVSVDVAIAFLQAGKAVFDEKPLATNLDDGRRLVRAVEATVGVYQIGFVFGYCDMVRNVARLARAIGTPAYYHVAIYDERLDRANPGHFNRIQQILRHSSAVTHEGSHVVDYFHFWNPTPFVRAQAMALKTAPDLHGPNLWSTRLETGDGSVLALDIGWLLPELPPSELHIVGPAGVLHVNFNSGVGELQRDGRTETVEVGRMVQPWERQLDGFAEAIATGRSTAAPVQRGWAALVATQACQQAQATGKTVEVSGL